MQEAILDAGKTGVQNENADASDEVDLFDPSLYFNRELSWLQFNQRVLNEALDDSLPLLERVKFIAIVASNLDEFFMIRVAGLRQQINAGVTDVASDGMDPAETLEAIHAEVVKMVSTMAACFTKSLLPALAKSGIVLHKYKDLDKKAQAWCEKHFLDEIFPVLTPLAIDPGHPFPHLLNRSLNLLVTVMDDETNEERTAVVQVPPVLSRLVQIPTYKKGHHFALLGEVIAAHAGSLFPGLLVKEWFPFRVTRNADLEIADDEASDLLKTIEEELRRRRWGAAVRLELDNRMPKKARTRLTRALGLTEDDVYQVQGPLNLSDFMELTKLDYRHLKYPPYSPRIISALRGDAGIFNIIRHQDLFFHHPYDSFSSIVDFIDTAADDPRVLAIKMTLYRTSGDSQILKSLARAAENGKQVTAFVELKARFDEENNIVWTRALEHSGVHVVYGILGLKTHAKLALIVRREKKGLKTYVHMSSGNYNEITARIYTDFGIMSCRPRIGHEASELFNYLTGYSHQTEWDRIIVAPISMRQKVLSLIEREAGLHTPDNPGHIIMKLNALVDPQMIRALYKASQAGVSIDLNIRGICCLRPGVPGVSGNIRVRSVVGRFLEHSRLMAFRNGGGYEMYISSADLMPRNLNRRVEAMFLVEDESIREHLLNTILRIVFEDNKKAYELQSDGCYVHPLHTDVEPEMNSQEEFVRLARAGRRKYEEE
jgi:polyphosphate kinase